MANINNLILEDSDTDHKMFSSIFELLPAKFVMLEGLHSKLSVMLEGLCSMSEVPHSVFVQMKYNCKLSAICVRIYLQMYSMCMNIESRSTTASNIRAICVEIFLEVYSMCTTTELQSISADIGTMANQKGGMGGPN